MNIEDIVNLVPEKKQGKREALTKRHKPLNKRFFIYITPKNNYALDSPTCHYNISALDK